MNASFFKNIVYTWRSTH